MSTARYAADVAARLREAGLRVTAPRVALLEELERNRSHPNPLEIHRLLSARYPSLSLSTVYLTIETFATAGLLRLLPPRDGHLRVDGVMEEHDHAVCRQCGDMFDLPQTSRPRATPRGLPRGTRVLGARVEYDVLCARCQSRTKPTPVRRRRTR
jgi:Fur family peroxide stress response transcriptional regulator